MAPMIPGVNFPLTYLVPYIICTLVVLVVHEVGHAAAGCMERLHIQGDRT